jgi:MFS transporter, DHA1 family, tetracycline resistance protein
MADSPQNPSQPVTMPDPLMTEPELIAPDTAFMPRPPAGRRAAATFIFFTVTLDMLALGMIAPVFPRLIEGFLHGDTSSAAKMLGLFGTVFAAMQFFCSPIVGSLSDRYGRRPLVLLSNFGLGLDYVLMAWAPTGSSSGASSPALPHPASPLRWPTWPTSPPVSAALQPSAC